MIRARDGEPRRGHETEVPDEWWPQMSPPHSPETMADTFDKVVRHYQFLVRSVALGFKTRLPSYITDEDLLSYGQFGLLKAIDRYRPAEGSFRRFASTYVHGAILDELRSQDWAPRGLRRDQRLLRQATRRLNVDVDPTSAQVAEHLGWETGRVESLQRQVENSHHQTLDNVELEDKVLDNAGPEATVSTQVLCELFASTFDAFDPTTQFVLARIYFLHETLTSVASSTTLPLAVVRQIHTEAIVHLFDLVAAATLAD